MTSVFPKNILDAFQVTPKISYDAFCASTPLKERQARSASRPPGLKLTAKKPPEFPPPIWRLLFVAGKRSWTASRLSRIIHQPRQRQRKKLPVQFPVPFWPPTSPRRQRNLCQPEITSYKDTNLIKFSLLPPFYFLWNRLGNKKDVKRSTNTHFWPKHVLSLEWVTKKMI